MTTVPNPSAPPATPSAGTDPPKFAGKYADDAAAHKGVSEIRKQVGLEELPTDKPLYGENGHFRDRAHAEAQYKEYERIYHATRRAAPVADLSIKPDAVPEADEPPDTVLERAGITREDAAKALEAGALTADQIAKIRQTTPSYKNLSDAKIQLIAKGHYAEIRQAESKRGEVYTAVSQALGGEEKHTAIRDWAKQNVDASIRDRWSEIVTKDPGMYHSMMNDMAARYYKAIGAGNSAPLVNGTNNAGAAGVPTSRAEFTKLMNKAGNGDVESARILSRMSPEQMNAFN